MKSAAALLAECGGTVMREDLDYSSAKYLMVRTIWLVQLFSLSYQATTRTRQADIFTRYHAIFFFGSSMRTFFAAEKSQQLS